MGEFAPLPIPDNPPSVEAPSYKGMPESTPGDGSLNRGEYDFISNSEPTGADEGFRPQTQTEAVPPAPPAGPPEGPPDDNDRVEEAFLEGVNPEDNKSEIPLKRPEDFTGNGDNSGRFESFDNKKI